MSIKSDRWIRRMATEHGMIEPFTERQVREGVISYGLSSYGYDMRDVLIFPPLISPAMFLYNIFLYAYLFPFIVSLI